jgi:hypothetical protein
MFFSLMKRTKNHGCAAFLTRIELAKPKLLKLALLLSNAANCGEQHSANFSS